MRLLQAAPAAVVLLALAGAASAEGAAPATPAAAPSAVAPAGAAVAQGKRDHATRLGVIGAIAFFALCAAASTTLDKPARSRSGPKP